MQFIFDFYRKISNIDVQNLNSPDALNLFIAVSSLFISVLSFGVAAIALIYAWIQFVLKSGTSFHGMYLTATSVWSKQRYIAEVVIENKKDKSIAINYIYLKIAKNIYLELADYNSSPRIIAPFETIKINSDEGVSGYISSTYRVDMHSLLGDRKKKKNLIVVTPTGISKVKRYRGFWNVNFESLRNRFIIPVHPVKKYYNGKEYSDTLQFVVANELGEEKFLYRDTVFSTGTVSIRVNDFDNANDLRDLLVRASESGQDFYKVEKVGYTYSQFESYSDAEIPAHGFFVTVIWGNIYSFFSRWGFRLNMYWKSIKKRIKINC